MVNILVRLFRAKTCKPLIFAICIEKFEIEMSEEVQIVCNQEYCVAKIYGCNDYKNYIDSLGIAIGKSIVVTGLAGDGKVVVKVAGSKKSFVMPKTYLDNISLVSVDDPNCQDKIVEELDSIRVSVMQTAESYPTNLFGGESQYSYGNYNLSVTYLPKVDYIFGNDYPNKRFRNLILSEKNDVIVAVVDFYKLETELQPIVQMLDFGAKMVMLVRGYVDEDENGMTYDMDLLSKYLGIPIALYNEADETDESRTVALETILSAYTGDNPNLRSVHANYGRQVERHISLIKKTLAREKGYDFNASPRFLAISMLEEDTIVHSFNTPCRTCNNKVNCFVKRHMSVVGKQYDNHVFYVLKQARRSYIDGLLSKVTGVKKSQWDAEKADSVLTQEKSGIPIFILIMAAIFCATFELGRFPMEWIANAFASISDGIRSSMSEGVFRDLLADGIIGGIGCVLSFVPMLFIFFLLVGILENSGYLGRVSFCMDKFMRKLGLQGKSFVPVVLGFGCSIPAIMSARAIESKKDRIISSMMLPFLPCAARWPICIMLVAAFFPKFPALIMLAVYLVGMLLALAYAKVSSKIMCRQPETPYVIELSPYRHPTVLVSLSYMWNRTWEYLKRISGIVVLGVLVVWALSYFPHNDGYSKNYDALISKATTEESRCALQAEKLEEQIGQSALAKVGGVVEPVFRPLGFDWKLSVVTLSGFAGKELTVSTMSMLGVDCTNSGDNDLHRGKCVALAFVFFMLICFPCFGATSAIRKVSGVKWAAISAGVSLVIAWLVAFGIFQIGMLI